MAVYAIGDIQGCFDELMRLLELIEFDESCDKLWFCGDLVNRGPKSLETLRYVKSLGDKAVTVLGNHDLHLLAKAYGHGKFLAKDTLDEIINAPDSEELLTWLRNQPLFHRDKKLGFAMVHAGLVPQWDLDTAQSCANELHEVLSGDDFISFLSQMYGNKPDQWSDSLEGIDRLRFITNVFTRLRYCDKEGRLDYKSKGAPGSQSKDYFPWFKVKGRKSKGKKLVFGHWSTLGTGESKKTFSLDGGCLWGGQLVALRLDKTEPKWFSLPCEGACAPG